MHATLFHVYAMYDVCILMMVYILIHISLCHPYEPNQYIYLTTQ